MTDPVVHISGNAKNGFIVEVNNGNRCMAYGIQAADAEAAGVEALRRFTPPAPTAAPVAAPAAPAAKPAAPAVVADKPAEKPAAKAETA